MPIEITDLSAVSPDAVAQEEAKIAQLLGEAFPQVDLGGALGTLLLHLHAAVQAADRLNLDRYRLSQSLRAVSADPTLADPEVFAALLSNWRVTPRAGAAASGRVTVVLTALAPTVVPGGAEFTAGGVTFRAPTAVVARADPSQVTAPTDRVLSPLGDGRYAFTVPVVCETDGLAGMLRRGTAVTPSFSVRLLDSCYAEADFAGGVGAETNADLLLRFQQGVAAPTWSNRVTVDAMLRAQPAFAAVLHTSVVGAGDPEMVRDKHSILPLALFGRCDCYVRTQALTAQASLLKTATLVDFDPSGAGIWQFTLGRDDAPGFYEVTRVAKPTDPQSYAGYEVVATARGLDGSPDGTGFVPDLATPAEAAFSRFATAAVRYVDPATPTAGLAVGAATVPVAVAVRVMPLVADLQSFLGGRGVRGPGGDVLVRAPVPCLMAVSLDVVKPASAADPDTAAVAAAAAAAVNALRFPGQVPGSALAAAAQAALPPGMAVTNLDMFGRVVRPDGASVFVRNGDVLIAPDDPANMTTGRTVAFFLDPADVAVTVTADGAPEV